MAAVVAPPPATTPKNFHDSIRAMFSGIGASAATSTTSLAYTLEHGAKTSQTLLDENRSHHSVVVRMMEQQTGLLKRIANKRGGAGVGSGILGGILDDVAGDAAEGLGKRILKKIFGPLFTRIGEKIGLGKAAQIITKMKGGMVAGLEKTAMQGGNFIVKAVAKTAMSAFAIVASAGRALFKPLIGLKNVLFSSGILKSVATFARFAGGGVVKILGKLAWPLTAILGIVDGISGWMNADKLLGKASGGASFTDKIASAAGAIVNGLLLGIPNWLLDQFGGPNLSKVLANGKDVMFKGISFLGRGIMKLAIDTMQGAITLIPKVIKTVLTVGTEIRDKVYGIFESVKDALWDGLTGLATSIKDAISGVFTDMWGSVKDWWNAPPNSKAPSFRGSATGGVPYSRGAANQNTIVKPPVSGRGTPANIIQPIAYSPSGAGGIDASAAAQPGMSTVTGGYAPPVAAGGAGSAVGSPSRMPIVSATGNPGTLAGGGATENAKSWYNFFTTPLDKGGMGYTSDQAKGFIATMQGESGASLNSAAYNPNDNGGPSGGTAQWHNERLTALKKFAADQGKDWTDVPTQQQFMKTELLGSHAHVDRAIRATTTAQGALDVAVRKFEVPQYPDSEVVKRSKNLGALSTLGTENSVMPAAVDTVVPSAARAAAGGGIAGGPFILGQGNATPSQINNMGGFLNPKSIDLLSKINPDLAAVALNAQKYMPAGTAFQVGSSTIRSIEDQQRYVAQGRSKTMDSNHLTGRAADLLPYFANGKPMDESVNANYDPIAEAMKKSAAELGVSMNWGGDWKSFVDSPHFELPKKYQDSGGAILNKLFGSNNQPTPTSTDMAAQSQQQRATIQNPLLTPKQTMATPMFNDAVLSTANKFPAAAPMVPVDTRNTSPIAAGSDGNKGSGNAIPGSFKVSELPVTDEYKMLLANGSILT